MSRAKQSPPDPFKPKVNHPVQRSASQTPAITKSSAPGKQLVPITDGKSDFRLPNKRQGFSGVAVKYSRDKKA